MIRLDDTDWSFEEARAQLHEELAAIADALRAEETKKMVILIEVGCRIACLCVFVAG